MRQWLIPDEAIFADLSRHGNTKWSPLNLLWLALLWTWSEQRCLTDAFAQAMEQAGALLPGVALTTYQGLMNALLRWSSRLVPLLCQVLHQHMSRLRRHYHIAGWVPLAIDGFRCDTPRTKSNEAAFCAKNYGHGKRSRYGKKKSQGLRRKRNKANPPHPPRPQVWCTMIWHMALRLPWRWRIGASDSSERFHAQEMIDRKNCPENTLFIADAGFVGFLFWSHLLNGGHQFLMRVGSNVHLLSEHARWHFEKEGSEVIVLCWPRVARDTKKPPLRVRLMRVMVGKTEMCLLTSVLDETRLSQSLARQLYAQRWGVEVEIRGLKQTMDRVKLRCRESGRLLVELEWAILGLAVVELLAVKEQLAGASQHSPRKRKRLKTQPPDPSRRSLAQALRVLRGCLAQPDAVPLSGKTLATLLRQAVTDDYVRTKGKHARYRPKNPDKQRLGDPVIATFNAELRKQLRQQTTAIAA